MPNRSCDLVTAAQAAHWFDLRVFYSEARRVLKLQGILALWGYARIHVTPEIDPVIAWFENERVGRYWPRGRELATGEYKELPFVFPRLQTPAFVMEHVWTCEQFLGYLDTWSAVDRCRQAEPRDPLPDAAAALMPLWGPDPRVVRWPIHMVVGRNDGREEAPRR